MNKLIVGLLICISTNLFSQDTIYLASHRKISCKVLFSNNYYTKISINNNDSLQFDIKNIVIDSIRFQSGMKIIPSIIDQLNHGKRTDIKFQKNVNDKKENDTLKKPQKVVKEINVRDVISIDALNQQLGFLHFDYLHYNKSISRAINFNFAIQKNVRSVSGFYTAIGYQFLSHPKRNTSWFFMPGFGYSYTIVRYLDYVGYRITSQNLNSYQQRSDYNSTLMESLNVGGNFYIRSKYFISPYFGYTFSHIIKSRFNTERSLQVGLKFGIKIR